MSDEYGRITKEDVKVLCDIIEESMIEGRLYRWHTFFEFAEETDMDVDHNDTADRGRLSAMIEQEFMSRASDTRLQVTHGQGVTKLKGKQSVEAAVLKGFQKLINVNKLSRQRMLKLSQAAELPEDLSKILRISAGKVGSSNDALAGTILRQNSMPKPLRDKVLNILGYEV